MSTLPPKSKNGFPSLMHASSLRSSATSIFTFFPSNRRSVSLKKVVLPAPGGAITSKFLRTGYISPKILSAQPLTARGTLTFKDKTSRIAITLPFSFTTLPHTPILHPSERVRKPFIILSLKAYTDFSQARNNASFISLTCAVKAFCDAAEKPDSVKYPCLPEQTTLTGAKARSLISFKSSESFAKPLRHFSGIISFKII